MYFPIVKVTTTDGYHLQGLLCEPRTKTNSIIIHIHGSAGNFYYNDFYPYLSNSAGAINYSFLTTNNRGSDVYNIEAGTKFTGAAIEIFEECLLDIDAWIEFALSRGYNNFILEGHSFGTNKIQYYMQKGNYKEKIKSLILLGFTDSYGGQLEYLKKVNKKNEDFLNEARKLIDQGRPFQLLSDLQINWGELPQCAQSYLNFMTPNSSLSNILPLGQPKKEFTNFKKISIPVLGVVGDIGECTVVAPHDAVDRLNNENKNAKCFMIKNCDHSYHGREEELTKIINNFIKKQI